MAATAPLPQHLTALQRANAIRLRRAAIKRELKAGTTTIRDVLKVHELAGVDTLEDVDEAIAAMPVGELLGLPHRWGVARVRKLLAAVNVPESKPVGELTSRRRRAIVAAVEGREHATRVEYERIAAARVRREREAYARAREAAARRQLREQAERERVEREAATAAAAVREPVDPLDVTCPYCRSEPGEVCSTYDPVHDVWAEPKQPHRPRLKRAGLLS